MGCVYQKNQEKSRLDWYGENAPPGPVGAMGDLEKRTELSACLNQETLANARNADWLNPILQFQTFDPSEFFDVIGYKNKAIGKAY